MQLATCPADTEVDVVAVGLEADALLRATELGLRVGARVRVLHRGPKGSRVVAVGGTRLALDGATAAGVEVRRAS